VALTTVAVNSDVDGLSWPEPAEVGRAEPCPLCPGTSDLNLFRRAGASRPVAIDPEPKETT